MKFDFKGMYTVFLLAIILNFIKYVMQFYFPILYVELGFDAFQIGFIFSISFLLTFLIGAPVGILCDRVDLRKIVFIALVFYLIAFFGMFNYTDYIPLVLVLLFFRAANIINKTGLENIIYKIKSAQKNILIGDYNAFTFIGSALGLFIGGNIIFNSNFDGLFSSIITLLLLLIPLTFFLPRLKTYKTKLQEYKFDLLNRKFIVLAVVLFLYALHFGAEHISYSLFLKYELNLDFSEISIYLGLTIFVMVFASLYIGRVSNHKNTIRIFIFSLVVSGIGHILMTQGGFEFSLLARILHEIADAFFMVIYMVLLKDSFSSKRIGGNSGALGAVMTFGTIVGCFLFSYIGFDFSHSLSLISSGVLSILSAVVLFNYRKMFR